MAKAIKVEFTNFRGDTLSGRMDLPEKGEPTGYALFAHCFACSKDIAAASRISKALSEQQIAVFRFDFTGLGNSGGDFKDTTFTTNVHDLMAAARMLEENYQAPCMLIGHSLGGAAVLAAAGHIPSSRAVVTIGAPFDPAHVKHHFEEHMDEIEQEGVAEVKLAGISRQVSKEFLEDLDKQNSFKRLQNLGRALLIFHSPVDTTVDISEAKEIYQSAKHPKSFISLDNADHLLTNKLDSEYVAHVISAWSQRYILNHLDDET